MHMSECWYVLLPTLQSTGYLWPTFTVGLLMYATSVLLYVLFRNIKFGGKLSIMVCVELILGNQGHEVWEGGGDPSVADFPSLYALCFRG